MKRGTSQLQRSAIKRKRLSEMSQRKQDDRAWFEASKEIIRKRSGGQCEWRYVVYGTREICTQVGTDAHHIVRQSQGHDHSPENLKWFCREHHDWCHKNISTARMLGYLSPAKTGDL
jgi:hypothetical protein